jgi:hypothetical protein
MDVPFARPSDCPTVRLSDCPTVVQGFITIFVHPSFFSEKIS